VRFTKEANPISSYSVQVLQALSTPTQIPIFRPKGSHGLNLFHFNSIVGAIEPRSCEAGIHLFLVIEFGLIFSSLTSKVRADDSNARWFR
jgi:hypothetical protein